jgi:hypothetical protein
MHVRGVDTLMVLSYLHIFKKIIPKKLRNFWIWRLNVRWLRFFMIPLYHILRYIIKLFSLKWFNFNYRC